MVSDIEKECPWVALAPDDIDTYPRPMVAIEVVFKRGAISKMLPDYVHAFGMRDGIDSIYLPLLRISVPLAKIFSWRVSPYACYRSRKK